LFCTGMRVSELCSLDREKVDVGGGEISIRGKGSKIRLVFLSDQTKKDLSEYLKKRADADEAMFIRIPRGKNALTKTANLRLTPRSIQRIIKKYSIKAGIVGMADIRSVQALLGHSSVTTTQIYTHVTDKQLREVHKKFHNKK